MLDPGHLLVTKYCCLACWELMDVLRVSYSAPDDFLVRGCHSTVYPVILPPCLEQRHAEDLVARFECHLYHALVNLEITGDTNVAAKTHRHTDSLESILSRLSDAPSTSSEESETDRRSTFDSKDGLYQKDGRL